MRLEGEPVRAPRHPSRSAKFALRRRPTDADDAVSGHSEQLDWLDYLKKGSRKYEQAIEMLQKLESIKNEDISKLDEEGKASRRKRRNALWQQRARLYNVAKEAGYVPQD